MASNDIYKWLQDHELINRSGLCEKAGIDKSNFKKAMDAGKELSSEVELKIRSVLKNYGLPQKHNLENFHKVVSETPKEVKQYVSDIMDGQDRKNVMVRILVLENELKNPPPSPVIGKKTWLAIREKELKELKALV